MAKWKVVLTFKDVVTVEVEAENETEARNKAVELSDSESGHDYFLYDSEETKIDG